MKQLNMAIIGSGMIANTHVLALREIAAANICGVWSRNGVAMKEFAQKYHLNTYPSYQAVLADPQVDTVLVTLPPGTHVEYGLQAVAAGKNIILEKPMDIEVERCQSLIKACREQDRKLAVIFQNRYTPSARKIKAALEAGLLGRIFLADAYIKWFRSDEYYASSAWRGTWEMEGGGALINQAIHTIDLLQWFMGGAVSVNGLIKTVMHDIETEDLGLALVEYANGAVGVIEGSTAVVPGFKERIEIHGEHGSIILEGGNIREWKVTGCQESDYVVPEKVVYGDTNSPAISYVNHRAQLEEIVQAFLEGKEPLVNGEEGLKSLQIVCGIYKSAAERRPIQL